MGGYNFCCNYQLRRKKDDVNNEEGIYCAPLKSNTEENLKILRNMPVFT